MALAYIPVVATDIYMLGHLSLPHCHLVSSPRRIKLVTVEITQKHQRLFRRSDSGSGQSEHSYSRTAETPEDEHKQPHESTKQKCIRANGRMTE